MAAGAAAGGFGEVVDGPMVKHVYYSVMTDFKIKVRLPGGQVVNEDSAASIRQGTSGGDMLRDSYSFDMQTDQTRGV